MALVQYAYRFFNDDGGEATATPYAAENTNVSLPLDTNIHLRIGVTHDGGAAPSASSYLLFASPLGLNKWFEVSATGAGKIRLAKSGGSPNNIPDAGQTTSRRLSLPSVSPTPTFVAGRQWDTATGSGNVSIGNGQCTELACCLQAVSANGAVNGEIYEFRMLRVVSSGGAFTLAQAPVDGASSASPGVVVIPGVTAGNNLIIGVRWDTPAVDISSITVSGESNATVRGSKSVGGGGAPNGACQFATLLGVTAGGSKTITVAMSGSTGIQVFVMEVAGTMSFDSATPAATSGTSSNPSTTITTTGDDDFIASILLSTTGPGSTNGAGYTQVAIGALAYDDCLEYKLAAGVAGSKTVDWVQAGPDPWILAAIAMKH